MKPAPLSPISDNIISHDKSSLNQTHKSLSTSNSSLALNAQIFKPMRQLKCMLLLSAFLLMQPLAAQNPCSLTSECSGGCCELLEVNDILGYYC